MCHYLIASELPDDASTSSGLSDFYDTFDVLEDDLDALDLPNFYKVTYGSSRGRVGGVHPQTKSLL